MRYSKSGRQFWSLSLPFMVLVVGGSFLMAKFIEPQLKIERRSPYVEGEKSRHATITRLDSSFSLQREYLRLQKDLNIEDWELKSLD
jgi:p-aminobenzoyl-glutamate transporter AbgT